MRSGAPGASQVAGARSSKENVILRAGFGCVTSADFVKDTVTLILRVKIDGSEESGPAPDEVGILTSCVPSIHDKPLW